MRVVAAAVSDVHVGAWHVAAVVGLEPVHGLRYEALVLASDPSLNDAVVQCELQMVKDQICDDVPSEAWMETQSWECC